MTEKKQESNGNYFTEEQLQIAWNRLKKHHKLDIHGEDELIMLSPGTWNFEAGPDFLNAKFAQNGVKITGDVEIHKKTSDWSLHGHQHDRRYDNVILHVVAWDDSENCTLENAHNLPDIPVLLLKPKSKKTRIANIDKFPRGQCGKIFASMEDKALEQLFRHAGLKRFSGKVNLVLEDMHSTGVNSAFLKLIFDACGYKKNRKQFAELFQRVSRYSTLSPIETEAVLWGESGLLPDPVTADLDDQMNLFVSNLWDIWWKIRKSAEIPIQWVRTGIRPMNSPERRIAALSVLIAQMGTEPLLKFAKIAKKSNIEKDFLKKVLCLLRCSHPLWNQYNSFTTKSSKPSAVLGDSRASDICVNTILPSIKAYALLTGDTETGEFVENVFKSLPKTQQNRILKIAALKWFMPPIRQKQIFVNAVTQQGALHIYRNFCEQLCTECEICPLGELLAAHIPSRDHHL